jgi:hypothetical protein
VTSNDIVAQVEANQQLIAAQSDAVALLNGLMDDSLPWQTTSGRQDYVDLFGALVPKGRSHYVQGTPSGANDHRLSAGSMTGVLKAVLSSHRIIRLAREGMAVRHRQMAEALRAVSISPQDSAPQA